MRDILLSTFNFYMTKPLLLLLFILTTAVGSTWGKVFLHHPEAHGGQEIWFRNIFMLNERPDSAVLTLSTSGYAMAYINERVADTQTIWPYRALERTINRGDSLPELHQFQQGIATKSIDVTHLVGSGRNILAIWYAPCINVAEMALAEENDSIDTPSASRYQLLPKLTIWRNNRSYTVVCEDSEWYCHHATAAMTTSGEDFDAEKYNPEWKQLVITNQQEWMNPGKSWIEPTEWYTVDGAAAMAYTTVNARSNWKTDKSETFYIPRPMQGQLRITLRGTNKGQLLRINGMNYRCNGTTDEQMFTRFATVITDSITIENVNGKKFPAIQSVEMIGVRK